MWLATFSITSHIRYDYTISLRQTGGYSIPSQMAFRVPVQQQYSLMPSSSTPSMDFHFSGIDDPVLKTYKIFLIDIHIFLLMIDS